MLPDDVLLEIFDFIVEEEGRRGKVDFEEWHTLVHVCWRWRSHCEALFLDLHVASICV